MKRSNTMGAVLAGLGAGAINGLFGAGGGMVLIPLLSLLTDWEDGKIFGSSLGVILPICLVSLATGPALPFQEALPWLLGSGLGGIAAGLWGKKIPVKWLHRGLGILIIWGGVRYLWRSL